MLKRKLKFVSIQACSKLCCSPCCCSLKIFNSIWFVVMLLLSVSILTLIGVGIFLVTSSITYQLSFERLDRLRSFDVISDELGMNLDVITSGCLNLEGSMRHFGEYMVREDGDVGKAISFVLPQVQYVVDGLSIDDILIGMWTFLDDGISFEKQRSLYYDHGVYVHTNYTHSLDIVFDTNDLGLHLRRDFNITKIEPARYSDVDQSFYLTKHKIFEYWVYELPYISFSIGSGPFEDLRNFTGGEEVYAGNVWFGMTIDKFSDSLQTITPENTVTWLSDIGLDILLGVSDGPEVDELFVEGTDFLSPREYTRNPVVESFSKFLDGDNELLDDIRSGELTEITISGMEYLIKYWDLSEYSAEWLLVNAKEQKEIYRRTNITIIILVLVTVVFACFGFCWCSFIVRLAIDILIIRKEMKKVDKMKLDYLSFPCSCFSFMEIRFLQNRVLKMVEVLKEYRAFLPEQLLDVIDPEDEKETKNESLTASVSSGSSNTNSSNSSDSEDASEIYKKSISSKFSVGLHEHRFIVIMVDISKGKSITKLYESILSSKRKGVICQFDIEYIMLILLHTRTSQGLALIKNISQSLERNELSDGVRFYMCCDFGITGNLGDCNTKKFCFGGRVKERIFQMKQRIPEYKSDSNNFVCENCSLVLGKQYELRIISEDLDFEIGSSKKIEEDEWMYEMDRLETLRRWDIYNRAVDEFLANNHDDAKVLFSEHLEKQVNGDEDVLCNIWIEKCDKMIEERMPPFNIVNQIEEEGEGEEEEEEKEEEEEEEKLDE